MCHCTAISLSPSLSLTAIIRAEALIALVACLAVNYACLAGKWRCNGLHSHTFTLKHLQQTAASHSTVRLEPLVCAFWVLAQLATE